MKTNLLLTSATFILTAFTALNQLNSDDPVFFNQTHVNTSHQLPTVKTIVSGQIEVEGEILLCDSTNTTLTVSGACSYNWYSDAGGNTLIGSNNDLDVTGITNDTIVYLTALITDTAISLPLPVHNSVYTGNTRGYWFQSPSTIQITGVNVPIDAGTGVSSVAIVRFNSGPPPTYSITTNDFTVLGFWQNFTEDTLSVCVPITSGDYIGVLGVRGSSNSYATAPYTSSINGIPVDLTRLGMQYDLSTIAPQELWTEAGSSISRVNLIYGDTLVPTSSIIAVNINVPSADSTTTNLYICSGDSILYNGIYYSSATTIIDSTTNVSGCDSISFTNIIPSLIPTTTLSGETLSSTITGDSYQWVDCDNNYTPIVGETSSSFTAINNGSYAVVVTTNGCSDTSACMPVNSTGIQDNNLNQGFTFYPNPSDGELTLQIINAVNPYLIEVYNVNGQLVYSRKETLSKTSIDVSRFNSGLYFMTLTNDNLNQRIKFIRK